LTDYLTGIASHLKPDGTFVGINNNPFDVFSGIRTFASQKYIKRMHGSREGGEVVYDLRPDVREPIVNFHLSGDTYEAAFARSGLSIEWHPLVPHDEFAHAAFPEFKDMIGAPYIAFRATKRPPRRSTSPCSPLELATVH
jgi:hypothetical protein